MQQQLVHPNLSSLFGVPAINLGSRQTLREAGANVHNCQFNKNDIISLFNTIKDKKFDLSNVYYKHDSSRLIADKLLQIAKGE